MSASRKRSSAARGYGWAHQVLRRRWAPQVEAGLVDCARCGLRLEPGQAWDLGHNDLDRSRYTGPEHARSADCPAGGNRATNRHRVERDGRRTSVDLGGHSRDW